MQRAAFVFLVSSITACSSEDAPSDVLPSSNDGGPGSAACEREREFIAAHQACSNDSDCTIVGSCSGGFGFEAVQLSASAQAQSYSDHTSCGKAYDGPTYNAACEAGRCAKRDRDQWCGTRRPIDGGTLLDASTDEPTDDDGGSDGGA